MHRSERGVCEDSIMYIYGLHLILLCFSVTLASPRDANTSIYIVRVLYLFQVETLLVLTSY